MLGGLDGQVQGLGLVVAAANFCGALGKVGLGLAKNDAEVEHAKCSMCMV